MHNYRAEMDLALTYALRRPRLALKCARAARAIAVASGYPAAAASANDLIAILTH